jgi:hypothetical protein
VICLEGPKVPSRHVVSQLGSAGGKWVGRRRGSGAPNHAVVWCVSPGVAARPALKRGGCLVVLERRCGLRGRFSLAPRTETADGANQRSTRTCSRRSPGGTGAASHGRYKAICACDPSGLAPVALGRLAAPAEERVELYDDAVLAAGNVHSDRDGWLTGRAELKAECPRSSLTEMGPSARRTMSGV